MHLQLGIVSLHILISIIVTVQRYFAFDPPKRMVGTYYLIYFGKIKMAFNNIYVVPIMLYSTSQLFCYP